MRRFDFLPGRGLQFGNYDPFQSIGYIAALQKEDKKTQDDHGKRNKDKPFTFLSAYSFPGIIPQGISSLIIN
jgi:hypothetical protein